MNTTALDGTAALITGASSGIGDATARQQAEHASVAVAARARTASTRSSRSSKQRAAALWRSRPTSLS